MIGGAHLFSGDLIQAGGFLLQGARLALDDGNILQLGIALQVLCALAAAEDHPMAAARLLGASTTLVPYWPLGARRYAPFIDRARDELGDRFDADVEAGKDLTPDQAVGLALDPRVIGGCNSPASPRQTPSSRWNGGTDHPQRHQAGTQPGSGRIVAGVAVTSASRRAAQKVGNVESSAGRSR